MSLRKTAKLSHLMVEEYEIYHLETWVLFEKLPKTCRQSKSIEQVPIEVYREKCPVEFPEDHQLF